MKRIFTITLLLLTYGAFAQANVKKSSISTSGGSATAGDKEIVFTIGETHVREVDMNDTHLSEGFIGPDILETMGVNTYGTLTDISIFPNPATDHLTVLLPQYGDYEFYLFDLTGKLIIQRKAQDTEMTLNISHLNTAEYMLIVIDRPNKLKNIFKIIKQ